MKHLLVKSLYFACGLILLTVLLPSCATTDLHSTPPIRAYQNAIIPDQEARDAGESGLKVMTLNLAHGRGTGFHQLLQQSDATVENLDNIATLLNTVEPDIVALQEADAPSFWSGNFNHVEYLASQGTFAHSVQASHVDAMGLSYGTALISRLSLINPQAVTFDPSLSPIPKGFVVSTITWPGRADVNIDVVSVHLDFTSRSIRTKQADELIAILQARDNCIVLMGDLNSGWQKNDSVVQYLAEKLELAAYQPKNRELVTFPSLGERLDWILVSPGLEFRSHEVIGTEISDHQGVVAELILSSR